MRKNQYDEMQIQKRNEIGNQTLSLMIILLMLDALFYNLGFQWITYPSNIFSIVILCSGIFVIRSSLNGILIAPKQNITKSAITTIIFMAITMIGVTLLIKLIDPQKLNIASGSSEILNIISVISILIILATIIIYFVRRSMENKLDD